MLRYLHSLSAILFYILGSGFFVAYVLLHNGILASLMHTWLKIGTLPLLLVSLLYGGISVYRSIRNEASSSTVLVFGITVPLALFFLFLLLLNFT